MEQIIKVIAHYSDLAIEDIKPESNVRDLVEDSLDFVELIITLEDEFNIDIADGDIDRLITIQDIAEFIQTLNNKSGAV